MTSPYRPLFVQGEPVKIVYKITRGELREALRTFIEQDRDLSADIKMVLSAEAPGYVRHDEDVVVTIEDENPK